MHMVWGCIFIPFLRIRAFFRFLIPVFEWMMNEWTDGWMNECASFLQMLASASPGALTWHHKKRHLWTRTSLMEILGQNDKKMRQNPCNTFQVAWFNIFFFLMMRLKDWRIFSNKWSYFWWFLYSFTQEGRSRLDQVVGSLWLSPRLSVPRQWALC